MVAYVFVFGGVVSGVGKGVFAASLARAYEALGLRVGVVKVDPYLNVCARTLSPKEHGEVYVLDSGAETDLDLGHYERFLGRPLPASASVTGGRVVLGVLLHEQAGGYAGQSVQFAHVERAYARAIEAAAADQGAPDVCVVEIGGTPGEPEAAAVTEAARLLAARAPAAVAQVSLLIERGEYKTKPTQQAVAVLRRTLAPDLVVCRSAADPGEEPLRKIHPHVLPAAVVALPDLASVYMIPGRLTTGRVFAPGAPPCSAAVHLLRRLAERTDTAESTRGARLIAAARLRAAAASTPQWGAWAPLLRPPGTAARPLVALVGKYAAPDAYLSLATSLDDAGARVELFAAELFERDPALLDRLVARDPPVVGVVVPGGFGDRGIEGKIAVCQAARRLGVPCLGICLGVQTMAVAAARTGGWADAGLAECGATNAVVAPMRAAGAATGDATIGDALRCGREPVDLAPGNSLMAEIYGRDVPLFARFRHRHAVAAAWEARLRDAGLVVSARSGGVPAALEAADGAFYLGVQYHPEFGCSPLRPSAILVALVAAARRFESPAPEALLLPQ